MIPEKSTNKSPSGANNGLDTYKKFCDNELQVSSNMLKTRYEDGIAHLKKVYEQKLEEFTFMADLVSLNTQLYESPQESAAQLMNMENFIGQLTHDNIHHSLTIDFWKKEYGQEKFIVMLSDIMSYFFKQFQIKENITDVQIMQLAIKLLQQQPHLKILELVFILNQALAGRYGPVYQRIGIDTVLQWASKYYEDCTDYLEAKHTNHQVSESRGSQPWEVEERRLKEYASKQREKKAITDKIWNIEKRQREVEEHKEKVLNEGPKQG